MKTMECTLENGKRILFNLDRISAVIEHGINPSTQTVIRIDGEEWVVMGSYDVILRIAFQIKKAIKEAGNSHI
jgi:hypothetical protein